MLISQKLVDAINAQIGREFGASQQYVAIAAHFGAENLLRLAHYFYRQAEEEREHAMKFVHHVVEAGGRVTIPAIPAPRDRFASAEEAVKLSLDWEMEVTKQIYALVNQAAQEGNWVTHHFLQWFVDEQLEEVSSMDQLLSVVKMAGPQLLLVEDYLARTGHPEEGKGG
ncbi:MAG TPA: ferritin [bacterium]|nr:ferritin [bacterium]